MRFALLLVLPLLLLGSDPGPFRVIDFGPQKRAARHMTSNPKIMGPDDIEGLKMRLPAIPIWVDVWKELGALPTVIPAPEIAAKCAV